METDGEPDGGEADRSGRIELGRLLKAIESSEVLEKRIPLIKQLEEFSADDLGLILQGLLASWIDSTCSGVSHCTLHKSILQVALKCSDLDITDCLGQFLTLAAKASSWCGKHLQWSVKSIDQSQVVQEEEHNRLCLEMNSLSFSISTKLHGIAAKRFTVLRLEVPAGEGGQGAEPEECVLNMVDDDFPTLETMAVEVELAPAHLTAGATPRSLAPPTRNVRRRCTHCASEKTSRWLRGPDGPGTLCNACGQRFYKGRLLPSKSKKPRRRQGHPWKNRGPSKEKGNDVVEAGAVQEASRRCMHCASEKTRRWRRGPDGPFTLCNACGQRFLKGRLLQSKSKKRHSSSKENSAASENVAELADALPCGLGASLDAFFDHTFPWVSWEEAGPAQAAEEEEELEWLSNKDAFPSVETMAVEEAPALDPPRARTKGRRRVTATETTCRQANVPLHGDLRRCTHCATERTPQWRVGPKGPRTLCNACGVVFRKKGRLLPEYRPANSPTFSPLPHSNMYSRNETSATGEVHSELINQPAYGHISSPLQQHYSSLCRVVLEEETWAADRLTAEACRGEEESLEVPLLPECPPADSPALSLVSYRRVRKRRRKREQETFAAIRATAKARRAERAQARFAATEQQPRVSA